MTVREGRQPTHSLGRKVKGHNNSVSLPLSSASQSHIIISMQSNTPPSFESIVAMFSNLPEDMLAYMNGVVDDIMAQDPNGLDPSASSIASRFTESSSPRRRQDTAASPPKPSPPPPPPPSPPYPGAWDRGRACVVNATNTYWSYGREHGVCTLSFSFTRLYTNEL